MLLRSARLPCSAPRMHLARALSTTSPVATSTSTPNPPPRIAPLPTRSVLQVSGPDAQKFLKGQMCKDVETLGGGYSGFLNASGRILHTVFSVPSDPNTYLIAHESGPDHPAPLAKLLPPFRLRSKVRFKDVSDEWDVWGAWGHDEGVYGSPKLVPSATWRYGSGGAAERLWTWDDGLAPLGVGEKEVACWDLRAGWGAYGMGRKVFVPKGQKPSLAASHDIVSPDEYTLHRMILGVPEGTREIVPGSALPLESDMDIHGGVDFRKGCYLGQELTVRTYHTGATRKRILPVRLFPLDSTAALESIAVSPLDTAGPALPIPAVDIMYTPPATAASKKARSAGKLLSVHPTASTVGLALVRLEFTERVWADMPGTVDRWGSNGTLTADIAGTKWGVYVGHGEAYAEALRHLPPPPPPEDDL